MEVAIDITTAAGVSVDYNSLFTPNGVNFYIPPLRCQGQRHTEKLVIAR